MMTEIQKEKKFSIKVVIGVIAIVAIVMLARMLPVNEWLEAFNRWVQGLGSIGCLVFIAGYILATVLFLPGSILTLGAGFIFGVVGGSIAVSIGSVTGAAFCFLISRYLARGKISQKLGQNERFRAIDSAIGREGGKIVFLLRLSPIFPFNVLNYLLGLTAVPFGHYLLASWVGMLPGTILYVYLGYIGKASLEAASGSGGKGLLEYTFLVIGLIVTAIVTLYVTKIARQALKESHLEQPVENLA